MDNEIDRKIDVTAIHFLLVQNRLQTHDWTLIGSGVNGLGIQKCPLNLESQNQEYSRGSPEFPNKNLRLISRGVPELGSDKQTDKQRLQLYI